MENRYQVIIQPEAEQGIKEAYFWVSNYSSRQARNWLEGFYQAILSLKALVPDMIDCSNYELISPSSMKTRGNNLR